MKPLKILFLCTGNSCRSQMAEGWAKELKANESCPVFPGKTKIIHVPFDDPPKLAMNSVTEEEKLSHYRRVRDEIKEFIQSLPESLEKKDNL